MVRYYQSKWAGSIIAQWNSQNDVVQVNADNPRMAQTALNLLLKGIAKIK